MNRTPLTPITAAPRRRSRCIRRSRLGRRSPARWLSSAATPVAIVVFLLVAGLGARDARAEFGPCRTAAPTTPGVVVFVSDLGRSVNWYRDNVGLAELPGLDAARRPFAQMTVLTRGGMGITLAASDEPRPAYREPQVVCFVLEGPPAPPPGAPPVFLVDPDGVSVELPATIPCDREPATP